MPTLSGMLDGETVTATVTDNKGTNAGDNGTATITALSSSNYVVKDADKTHDWEIQKNSETTKDDLEDKQKPTANNLTYNGGDQALVTGPAAALPTGYTGVKYGTKGENDEIVWSDTVPTGKDAGDYTVYVKYVGDDNHADFEGDPINVTIDPKAVVVTPTAETSSKTYGDADPAFAYTADGLVGTDTLTGALARAAGDDVGEYAFNAGTLANPNYTVSVAEGSVFTIEQKAMDPPATPQASAPEHNKIVVQNGVAGAIYEVLDSMDRVIATVTANSDGVLNITNDKILGGQEYTVRAHTPASDTNHKDSDPVVSGKVTTPPETTSEDAVTEETTKGEDGKYTSSITIDPTVAGTEYVVVPKGTRPDWTTAKESENGEPITFDNLDPGTEYEVISRVAEKDDGTPASEASAPTSVTTTPAPIGSDSIETTKDTLTIKDPEENTQYTVKDNKGNTVATVTVAPDGSITVEPTGKAEKDDSGNIVVKELDPNKTYTVTSKKTDDEGNPVSGESEPVKAMTAKAAPESPVQDQKVGEAGNDGSINGVDDTMEYSVDGGNTWISVPDGATEIPGLSKGDVLVRYEAVPEKKDADGNVVTPAQPASEPKKVTVSDKDAGPAAPTGIETSSETNKITVTKPKNTDPANPVYEYSIDGGTTWQTTPDFTKDKDGNNLKPGTVYPITVRVKETPTTMPSEPATVNAATSPAPISDDQIETTGTTMTIKDPQPNTQYDVKDNNGNTVATVQVDENGDVKVVKGDAKKDEDGNIVVSGLDPDKKYTVSASVIDKDGNVISDPSEPVEEATDPAGKYIPDVEVNTGVPAVKVEGITSELAKALCTDDEKAKVLDGQNAYLFLELTNIDNTVSSEDKSLVEALAANLANGSVVARYIDISLFKKVGNAERTQLHSTNGKKIKFTLNIPAELRNKDKDIERTFYLIRVHDGKAEVLAKTTGDKLEFESDLFSTYAIAYNDKDISDDSGSGSSKGVRTGDGAMVYLWAGVLFAAAVLFLILVYRRRRTER